MYRFSPTTQASIEEKRVSVKTHFKLTFFSSVVFLLLRRMVRPDENKIFFFSLRMARTLAIGNGQKLKSWPQSRRFGVGH